MSYKNNPGIENYFIGDQYNCQRTCITENFWNEPRILREPQNGGKPVLDFIFKNFVANYHPCSILDIGCGPSQKMYHFLGSNPEIRITGIDSAQAVVLAKDFNPSGTYHICDLDSDVELSIVSKKMGIFDIILCIDVIEHVLHPEKMCKLIKQHAYQETKIFYTTLERDLSRGKDSGLYGSPKIEHIREWNQEEFVDFIKYMGFVVDDIIITPLDISGKISTRHMYNQTLICRLDV